MTTRPPIRLPSACTEPHVAGSEPAKPGDPRGEYTYFFGNAFLRSPGGIVTPDDEQHARQVVAKVKATIPMFLPFRNSRVAAGGGWYYNLDGNAFHAGIDMSKTSLEGSDPAFRVYSVADGTVISVDWDDLAGNVVVLEHSGGGGSFRSLYCHMRNGKQHDLTQAQAMTVSQDDKDGKGDNRKYAYSEFAHFDNPEDRHWGTEGQTIRVNAGDRVHAGQHIGWAGNTGYGGAGWGLARADFNPNNDPIGTPLNPDYCNVHLHLFMAIADPRPGSTDWVLIDPYGVYSDMASDRAKCYEVGRSTYYARLYAPFMPSFHNIPAQWLRQYWGYYTGMGMALQTVSVYWSGGQLLAAGSFQYGLSPTWRAHLYMTRAEFKKLFDKYHGQGFRPRQLGVTVDPDGTSRFTVIWQQRSNEGYYCWVDLTTDEYLQKWRQHVDVEQMRMVDHVVYELQGTTRHTVLFVGDGDTGFQDWHLMNRDQMQAKFNELSQQGWHLESLDVGELSGGLSYGGVWRPGPGQWPAWADMTSSDYQKTYMALVRDGFNLFRVEGYGNGDRFAAIWHKK